MYARAIACSLSHPHKCKYEFQVAGWTVFLSMLRKGFPFGFIQSKASIISLPQTLNPPGPSLQTNPVLSASLGSQRTASGGVGIGLRTCSCPSPDLAAVAGSPPQPHCTQGHKQYYPRTHERMFCFGSRQKKPGTGAAVWNEWMSPGATGSGGASGGGR